MSDTVYKILAINPGSTSTKVALYENETQIAVETMRHQLEELSLYDGILDQKEFRINCVMEFLQRNRTPVEELDAIVGRGGLIKPMDSGIYPIESL